MYQIIDAQYRFCCGHHNAGSIPLMVGDVIRQISGYRGQGLSRQVYNQVRFNHAVKGP